jgi:hypothetical protein
VVQMLPVPVPFTEHRRWVPGLGVDASLQREDTRRRCQDDHHGMGLGWRSWFRHTYLDHLPVRSGVDLEVEAFGIEDDVHGFVGGGCIPKEAEKLHAVRLELFLEVLRIGEDREGQEAMSEQIMMKPTHRLPTQCDGHGLTESRL